MLYQSINKSIISIPLNRFIYEIRVCYSELFVVFYQCYIMLHLGYFADDLGKSAW